MAITLASDEYDEVRLLIGGDIDEDDLPDRQIDADTVLGAAESYVLQRIPGGQTGLSAPEVRAYRRAVKYRCAWILAPSYPQQIAETAGQLSARHQGTPMDQVKAFLQEQVDGEIQKLVDAGHGVARSEDDEFMPAVDGVYGGLGMKTGKRENERTRVVFTFEPESLAALEKIQADGRLCVVGSHGEGCASDSMGAPERSEKRILGTHRAKP